MVAEVNEHPNGATERPIRSTKDVTSPASQAKLIVTVILERLHEITAKVDRVESAVSQQQDNPFLDLLICALIDLRTVEYRHRTIADIANKISGALYNVGFEEIAPQPLDDFNPALHRPSQQAYPTNKPHYHGRIKRTKRIGIMKDGRAFKQFAAEVELYQTSQTKTLSRGDKELFAFSSEPLLQGAKS